MGKMYHPPLLPRVVNREGNFNVVRKGASHFDWSDLYHLLLTLSWPSFLALGGLLYLLSNTFFALVYLAGGDCIQNAQPGYFPDAFFFSIQTMATIGYGAMSPRTPYANVVVTVEALVGLVGVAMFTGLAFARFSLPTARVLFSNVAVISPFNGVPTLIFRTANSRGNLIVEAQIGVTLVRNEVTFEGQIMRRFHDLKLVRRKTPIFALTWTVMHPIDEKSPLYGATAQTLAEEEVEIVVTLTGLDGTVSQTIHARHAFAAHEILWNMRFVDIFSQTRDGRRCIDYNHFHDVTPL
jgi:inward rectifier potassium channel